MFDMVNSIENYLSKFFKLLEFRFNYFKKRYLDCYFKVKKYEFFIIINNLARLFKEYLINFNILIFL